MLLIDKTELLQLLRDQETLVKISILLASPLNDSLALAAIAVLLQRR